jgi:transcriptional regulator of nitric oxide reductase
MNIRKQLDELVIKNGITTVGQLIAELSKYDKSTVVAVNDGETSFSHGGGAMRGKIIYRVSSSQLVEIKEDGIIWQFYPEQPNLDKIVILEI